MGPDVVLELVGALVVDSFGLVVNLTVFEYLHDVLAEMLTVSVLIVGKLLLDGLQVDWLFYYEVVVGDIFGEHWLSKGP